MSELIRYEVAEDGVATLTIDRPEKRNAMTYAMLGEFIETVDAAGQDENTRVIVLTGSGGAFCAGTDLADLQTIPGEERGLRGSAEEESKWWPLVRCPKPIVAAIDGPAVGMGAEFSSQCDVRIASTRTRFAWNFAHRGLVPDTGAGSWLLPRLLGPQRALELLYSGRFVTADEALGMGYVLEVHEPERVLPRALEIARTFLAGSPFSHRRIKELLYRGLERDLAQHMQAHTTALGECFKSADHKEGVMAFLERRPAEFVGK